MINKILFGTVNGTMLCFLSASVSFGFDASQLVPHVPAIHSRQTLATGITLVEEGTVQIIEAFGKFQTIAQPGFNWFTPLFTESRVVDLRTIFIDTPPQEALTKDVQKLTIDGAFQYRVIDPYKAVYNIQNLEGSLISLFYRNVLATIGQMGSDDAISLKRDELATIIRAEINRCIQGKTDGNEVMKFSAVEPISEKRTSYQSSSWGDDQDIELSESSSLLKGKPYLPRYGKSNHNENPMPNRGGDWGVEIVNVAITNITYPASIVKAMNDQREAEFRKTTMRIQAEADKQNTITEAEAQKLKIQLEAEAQGKTTEIEINIKLLTAKAEVEGKILRAQGEAEALSIQAEADAKRIERIGKVLQENPVMAQQENLRIASDAMTKLMVSPNSKIFFMNPTEPNNFLTQMMALQNIVTPSHDKSLGDM